MPHRDADNRFSCAVVAGAIALSCHFALPGAAVAQNSEAGEAVRDAREAQARFEQTRRRSLPFTGGGDQPCDARIGSFCYWYDEDESLPPSEPERVIVARRKLLFALDTFAVSAPDDEWLLGQRVRYWVEAGHSDSARIALSDCASVAWWCSALRGYSLHAEGSDSAAQATFERALAEMPDAERCRWQDVTLLLTGAARDRYSALHCAERAAMTERFWWLAQPRYSSAGNDRMSEHFARLTVGRMRAGTRSEFGQRWSDDQHELAVRYGWPDRWSRRASNGISAAPTVVGHEPRPAFQFLPAPHLLDEPFSATSDDWRPDDAMARARYAPHYARRFVRIAVQTAVFRRGDSLLVVAVRDSGARGAGARQRPDSAALALTSGERAPAVIARTAASGAPHVLAAVVPDAPHLASVEVSGDSAYFARWRAGIRGPPLAGAIGISDLLLYEGGANAAPSGDLALVLRAATGSETFPAPSRLGVYWELYRLQKGRQSVRMSLTVTPEPTSWLTRVTDRLRRAPPRAPVSLLWDDVLIVDGPRVSRGIVVELPELAAGRYSMTVGARWGSADSVSVHRVITIGKR